MARDPLRFARLLRTCCSRLQITPGARQPQAPDLHKHATPAGVPGQGDALSFTDLYTNPDLVGTEKR